MNRKIILTGAIAGAAILAMTGCNSKSPEVKPDESKRTADHMTGQIYAGDFTIDTTLDTDAKTLSSVVTAEIENNTDQTTDKIVFKNPSGSDFKVGKAYLGKDTSAELTFTQEGSFTDVDLGEDALKPGDSMMVTLETTQTIPENNSRFGYLTIGKFSEYILSDCFPVLARFADKDWVREDSGYSQASDYHVSLNAPSDYNTVASGNETKDENGVTHIEAMDIRDFAMVVCNDLRSYYWSNDAITVNYFYLEGGAGYKIAQDVIQLRVPIGIDWMESHLAKYHWGEYDIVMLYDDSEGIAHSGLMTFGGRNIHDGLKAEEEEIVKEKYASVFTAGLLEQWFTKMTGVDDTKEGWLSKGITKWLDDYVKANMYEEPEERHIEDIIRQAKVDHPKEMNLMLDDTFADQETADIVYTYRGAEFMEDLYDVLGDEKMTSVLRDYLTDNSLQMAHTENFMKALEKYSSDSVNSIIQKYFSKL